MHNGSEAQLDLKAIGDITGVFRVPEYQRGYRWGRDEVLALLDDIEMSGEQESGQTYCLQPIVLKSLPSPAGTEGPMHHELVDGQQRLTTLFLVYRYLERTHLPTAAPPFSITYVTRDRCAEYLASLDEAGSKENIDFFHIYNAYRAIDEWFLTRPEHRRSLAAMDLFRALGKRVKVIWYMADPRVESTTLFTRLNEGRIALTNAELIKAMVLARGAQATTGAAPGADLVERRQIEIANQWDQIERELHDRSFWAFLTNAPAEAYPTRIEFLFDLIAGRGPKADRLHTFLFFAARIRSSSAQQVWGEVLECHALLREWHDNHDLYHRIGFLVAVGEDLAGLLGYSHEHTKGAFEAEVVRRIVKRLDISQAQVEDIDYLEGGADCERLLLLFNVETTRAVGRERYPFHEHKSSDGEDQLRWSLEHIHAQNAESLRTREQWRAWLLDHREALAAFGPADRDEEARREALLVETDGALALLDREQDKFKERFADLSARVAAAMSTDESSDFLHSIGNLALLPSGANSALGNRVFEVKRRMILQMDREGQYIPICTRRVFLKYYTSAEAQQLHFWSEADRKAYVAAILSPENGGVGAYLKPEVEVAP